MEVLDTQEKNKMNNMRLLFFIVWIFSTIILTGQDTNEYNYQFALIEAARQKTIGNINEAIKLYKKCIEVNPESAVAYYELGSIYAALKQNEIAKYHLKKAYLMDSENYYYLLAYTQILNLDEDYDQMVKTVKDYLKRNDDIRVKYTLTNAYDKLGKDRKALRILNQIENERGISELIILKKVEILKEIKRIEKAEKELFKLLNLIPESPYYNIIIGEFYKETDQISKAVKYFHKAYELDSTNIFAISNLADYYTENGPKKKGLFFLNKAFSMEQVSLEKKISTLLYFMEEEKSLKQYNLEYRRIISTLLNQYPDNYEVKTIAYDYYNKIEDYEKSYEIIMELLDLRQDSYMLWQQAIYNASLLNKYDDIIKYGTEAKIIFPNKKELDLFLGIAYYQKSNYSTAYSYLSQGYDNTIDLHLQIQYLTFLAESAYKIRKIDESFYYFEELLLLDPDNYLVMNNYSYYMALESRSLQRAEELSEKAIERFPNNYTYLDTYAWILFKQEKFAEAKNIMDRIEYENISDADIFYHMAWIYCKVGKKEEAINFFNKAEELGYESEGDIDVGKKECEK